MLAASHDYRRFAVEVVDHIRRSFTELELERVSGSEEDVLQLAELVRTRLGLRYELRGKLSRAMNLRKRK